MKTNATQLNDI